MLCGASLTGHPSHSRPQANTEKMCRLYEDQMNEAKARVEELQRQLNDTNTQRACAQAESGEAPATHAASTPHHLRDGKRRVATHPVVHASHCV